MSGGTKSAGGQNLLRHRQVQVITVMLVTECMNKVLFLESAVSSHIDTWMPPFCGTA